MTKHASQEPRAVAAEIVRNVVQDKRSLDNALDRHLVHHPEEGALIHELAAGSLRWWWRLTMQVDQLLKKPFKTKDFDIYCLLVVGLYQLQFTRIPDHAAVSQTVNASKSMGKPWSTKLINALLRQCLRERSRLETQCNNNPVYRYSHPDWLIETLQNDWPDDWEKILAQNNKRASLTLRVNGGKTSVNEISQYLEQNQTAFEKTKHSPVGLKILDNTKIWQSELWQQGLLSVQDESAQLAAYMAELKPGMCILDACAAPGGKTCHLLELEPELKLLALEIAPVRMERLKEHLERLNLDGEARVADATDVESWWDGQPFDLILIDAPCSGSGVISKHPDIKHLRCPDDIPQNVQTQRLLLDKLWPILKTGGHLLYCTCSVFSQENDQQAQWFISKYKNASETMLDDRFGRRMAHGRQRLPSDYQADGFYYVSFCKTSD